MRTFGLFFRALAAGLLISQSAGASFAAVSPDGGAPVVTDNAADAAPSALDNAAGAAPSAADNAAGTLPPAADNTWVDRTHARVEKNLFETAVWLDNFFGDKRMEVTEPTVSFVRWMNDFRWDEEERFSVRSRIRAILRLPRLKRRWKLAFTGETRGDPNVVMPEDPGNPGLVAGGRARTGSTELIYDILRTPRSTFDVGAGVRVKIPPDAFVRTRFQHARPVAVNTLGRFTATAFWDARDGFGESNVIDLERWLFAPTLLRWSNSLEIREKVSGWTWGTELSLLHKISPKSAAALAAGVSGTTSPAWTAQNYRVLARYRRNVFRKWLFLEGEPDVHWPKKEDGSRKPVWGATLRVEILFAGAEVNPKAGGGSGP